MKIEELLPQVLQGHNPSVNIIIRILTKDVPALLEPSIYIVWHSKLGVFMKKLADLPMSCIKNRALPIFERFNALLSEPGGPQELHSVMIEAELVGRHYNAQRRGNDTLQEVEETPHPAVEETSLVIIEKPLSPILRVEKVSVNFCARY